MDYRQALDAATWVSRSDKDIKAPAEVIESVAKEMVETYADRMADPNVKEIEAVKQMFQNRLLGRVWRSDKLENYGMVTHVI